MMDVNRRLKRKESGYCLVDHVSENGYISTDLHISFPILIKGYQITANRKQLRTLKQIATSKSDVQNLHIPKSL